MGIFFNKNPEQMRDFLILCRAKLDNPSKWIQNGDARDWHDKIVNDVTGVKFSVLGVMDHVSKVTGFFKTDLWPVLKHFQTVNDIGSINFWQSANTTTYEMVIQAFTNAIDAIQTETTNEKNHDNDVPVSNAAD